MLLYSGLSAPPDSGSLYHAQWLTVTLLNTQLFAGSNTGDFAETKVGA